MFERFVNTFPNTDSEVLQKIEQYYALLIKWNKHHNLIQKNTLDPFVFEVRHLIDCWQLSCYFSKDNAILDVGSGAGLPGILLSIAGFNVHIVEQDHNKAVFLKNCKSDLNLSCAVICSNVYDITQPYQQITSRAFSSLTNLLQIQSNVSRETFGVFLKGVNCHKEIEEAYLNWDFDVSLVNSLSSENGKVVIVKKLMKKCFT